MRPPVVLGIDASLTGLGVAVSGKTWSLKLKVFGAERLDRLSSEVDETVRRWSPAVVAIEGYSFASSQGGERIGELGGCIRRDLWRRGVPYVEISPSTLKKYAVGSGNAAGKGIVLEAALKRFRGMEFGGDDDRADAWWLRAMALDWYGHPLTEMPAVNRSAMTSVTRKTNKRTRKTTITPAVAWPSLEGWSSPAWDGARWVA